MNLRIFIILSFIVLIFIVPVKLIASDIHQAEVVEHLGEKIPLDLTFKDSEGKSVKLKDLVNKPTVLDFVYYRCTGICTPLMVEVAEVINKVDLQPGKDYRIISISIDHSDTPKLAAQKKNAMFSLITKKIDPSSWEFLTGDSASITEAADAAGFYYQRQDNQFLHKGVLIFVDNDGKICSYLRPGYTSRGDFSILPSEFKMAIVETSQGKITETIAKVLQTCYAIIPKSKDKLVLGLIFITGLFTITIVMFIIKKTNLPLPIGKQVPAKADPKKGNSK